MTASKLLKPHPWRRNDRQPFHGFLFTDLFEIAQDLGGMAVSSGAVGADTGNAFSPFNPETT